MDPSIVSRINELARKAKSPEGLTEAELAERTELRKKYCDIMKCDLEDKLKKIIIVDANGNKTVVKKKDETN
jgi:uncharacterized protein YnzC (UPF0291/DUF896 family)